jgi:hypothetical protein
MKIIFIHGRAQEDYDEQELKKTWIKTFESGLAKNNLSLPDHVAFEFPYYGKLLKQWVDNPATIPPPSIAKRSGRVVSEDVFLHALLNELLVNAGEKQETHRGILNYEAVQKLLKKFDAKDGWGEKVLKLFTKDVFLYLTNHALQQALNQFIVSKFDKEPCIVVGHSLGTIVAYKVLSENEDFQIKKLITLGSPLGLASVIKHLPPPAQMPKCVQHGWFNAFDERDFVALHPLNNQIFPTTPPIENKNNVDNQTSNRHGIEGYLNDPEIAKNIYDALFLG